MARSSLFGVSGKLIMNALVMYDIETDSLWSQFLGQAVKGPMNGVKLTLLPAQLTTWSAWNAQHPGTVAPDKRSGFGVGVSSDRYDSYYEGGSAGILGETNKDRRLPAKDLVLGLVGGSTQRPYPLSHLATAPVTNDLLDGTSLVITHDSSSGAAAAFSRPANGRTLTFQPTELPSGGIAMTDDQTGSTWDLFSGQALEGPSAGHRLEPIAAPISFWFAWSDFYPDTEVYVP